MKFGYPESVFVCVRPFSSVFVRVLLTACLLLACLALPSLLHADGVMTEGRHQYISVVPAPGPVTLDGKLDDWDLSGEILTYENVDFAAKRYARTAMMYDKDYLYVYAYFQDIHPMHHLVDGRVDADRGWDGDALQLKMNTDPSAGYPIKVKEERPIGRDIQIWYCDAPGRNEAQLCIQTLKIGGQKLGYCDPHIYFGADTGTAFLKQDGGYTLEVRLPWKRLSMPGPPAPGTKLAFTTQHLWANDAGTHYGTSLNDITAPGGGFTYQSAGGWGYLLFEDKGHLARAREELPKPLEMAKNLSFNYALPKAGKVSLGIFNDKGALVRTLLTANDRPAGAIAEKWDGLNDFGEVLPVGHYTFKALTHQGFTQEFITSVLNSGTPPWCTADGTGSWGQVGTPIDITCLGDRVYLLWGGGEGGNNIQACTLDGKKLWGMTPYLGYVGGGANAVLTDGAVLYVAQWNGITKYDCTDGHPLNFFGDKRGIDIPGGINGLALLNGHLYVLSKGTVLDIELNKGAIVRTLAVGEGATSLKVAPGAAPALLFLRAGALCRLQLDSGAVDNLFPIAMGTPYALAVSPDGKRAYISDIGRLQNDISIFSYPDGKPLGIVGKPGGRPAIGKFDPNGLFRPGQMAFDSKGRLWVAEMDTAPNRFSVWEITDKDGVRGKFVKDFMGPSGLSIATSVDPAQPENVYIENMRWIVDYDKHTAKLDCTFARPGWNGPQPAPVLSGRATSVVHAKGRTFLFDNSSVWEMLQDHAVPVWAFGPGWVWSDKNHDGYMQEEEKEKDSGGAPTHYWGQFLRDDLTMEHNTQGGSTISLRPMLGWENDLPVWTKGEALKPTVQFKERALFSRWNPSMTRCYTLESNSGYGDNDMRRNGIGCYAPDGTRLWRFKAGCGMDFSAPITKPGEVRGAQKLIGFIETGVEHAGEIVGVNGYFGDYNLLNEDGLFVTELCQDYRRGATLSANFIQCENFNGFLFRHPKTKKVYMTGGDIDGRLWEIKGFDNLQRFHGTLEINDKDVLAVTQALADYQKAVGTRSTRFSLQRMATPPALDGSLASWDFSKAVKIEVTPGRGGKAMAAYDDKYLYLAYRVADDSAFVNNGTDPMLMFKTGDLVDVILCTQAGANPHRTVGKGDTRILFAPYQGKPIAVVMQKVADGGPAAPMTYTSSQTPETLQRVAILKNAKIGVKITPDGYMLEAAVPLADINFAPQKGKEYPFDFGILYGDTGGNMTILRAYWTNQDTAINNDTPTESRMQPANLGTAVVE